LKLLKDMLYKKSFISKYILGSYMFWMGWEGGGGGGRGVVRSWAFSL